MAQSLSRRVDPTSRPRIWLVGPSPPPCRSPLATPRLHPARRPGRRRRLLQPPDGWRWRMEGGAGGWKKGRESGHGEHEHGEHGHGERRGRASTASASACARAAARPASGVHGLERGGVHARGGEAGVRAARLPDRAMAARPPSWPHAPALRAYPAERSPGGGAARTAMAPGAGRRRGAARAGGGRRGAARASAWIGDNGDVRSGAHLSATETSQNCDGMALKALE